MSGNNDERQRSSRRTTKRTARRAGTQQAAAAAPAAKKRTARTRAVEAEKDARAKKTKKWQLVTDPRLFGEGWEPKPDRHRLAIGLDLGTMTGYSATYVDPEKPLADPLFLMQGQLDLRVGEYDSRGIIGVRLRAFLNKVTPDIIFMERVRYTPPQGGGAITPSAIAARGYTASEFFGGLMQLVVDWGYVTDTPVHPIPIGTIKQRATGKGNANKEAVIKAHNEQFGTTFPTDEKEYKAAGADNVCDSAFALVVGLENYAAGL